MELTDLQPLDQWMTLEAEIVRRSGLDANVFNVEGIRISSFKNWANRLCPAIKATDKGQSFICAVAHMNVAAQARQQKHWVVEECDAGLVKLVVPIFMKEEFIGAVGACGHLLDAGEVDDYMIHRTTGISEETIRTLSEGIGRLAMDKAEALAVFIETEVRRIVEQAAASESI